MKNLKYLALCALMLVAFGCDNVVTTPEVPDDATEVSVNSQVQDDTAEIPEDSQEPADTENSATVTADRAYVEYTPDLFAAASDKKRVIFFHAGWCPTCKAANEAFEANLDQIPEDVVVFKTDYDTEKELKKKYAITYQHTFVYVDAAGEAIDVWNGGDVEELIDHV